MQGENLEAQEVLKLIDAIQDNFVDIEIVSNTELRLKLERFDSNKKATKTLTSFIEKNKSKKYTTKVEYNEETGLVSAIMLKILER